MDYTAHTVKPVLITRVREAHPVVFWHATVAELLSARRTYRIAQIDSSVHRDIVRHPHDYPKRKKRARPRGQTKSPRNRAGVGGWIVTVSSQEINAATINKATATKGAKNDSKIRALMPAMNDPAG